MSAASVETRFPVVLEISPAAESKPLVISTRVRKSAVTGLHVVISQVPKANVFGNFLFLTKNASQKPVAAVVQRLTTCGSENFPADFVARLGREMFACSGSTLQADRSIYTISTENDRALIAMLPPYLDALFRPTMLEPAYQSEVFVANESRNRKQGNMYKDSIEASRRGNRAINVDELIYSDNVAYRFNYLGSPETIAQVKIEDARAFHRHYYRPSNFFMVLAGDIVEKDILEVMKAFEDELSPEILTESHRYPAKLACPTTMPILAKPDVFHFFPKDLGSEEDRRYSLTLRTGLRVRFVSEILMRSQCQQQTSIKEVHMHLVAQGPDVFDYTAYLAFQLLAPVFQELLVHPWHVDLAVKDRKFPICDFMFKFLILDEVERAHQSYEETIKSFLEMGDEGLACFLSLITGTAERRYMNNLIQDPEYWTVNSLVLWLASCSLSTPGARESLVSLIHASKSYQKLATKNLKWWRDVVKRYFKDPVMILEPAKGSRGAFKDDIFRPSTGSSRFTVSSLGSERHFPGFTDKKEVDWLHDEQVGEYVNTIGGRQYICPSLDRLPSTTTDTMTPSYSNFPHD